ncbi:tubulin tyrosine ligase [Brachionus plicatilis]|uniref:Tubulin tyrosine ligase n=1 Tax=Brachionus plicatilis TaxID=10195 RepID=A0A3M7PAH9_BRAPC|nr:tubulin tyrosine ligase [Brachionus plicatilis]
MCSSKSKQKIKVLIGIDDIYTSEKIAACFKYRDPYEVVLDDSDISSSVDLDYDLYWLEYEYLNFEKLIKPSKKVLFNSFCIRKGLIRKAQIAFYLRKYLSKVQSQLFKHVPETYVFELDYIDYLDEALNDCFEVEQALESNLSSKEGQSTKKFILKSSMTNKGAEILIFDTKKQLEDFFISRIENSEDEVLDLREWVIQSYIENPLKLRLYNNRKFHLRVYVLAVGNLKVYVYRDVLALFALEEYKIQSRIQGEKLDLKSHITNTCVQLEDIDKDSEQFANAEEECIKRFWDLDFDENKDKSAQKKNSIFAQIKYCVGEIFNCLHHEPTVFQPLENAFELYGFDFLIDEKYNCFFLEANAFPDFKQTGDMLHDIIDCLFYQTICVASDEFFGEAKICEPSQMISVYDKKASGKF